MIGGFNYFMPKTAGENCRNIATRARVNGKIPFFGIDIFEFLRF